MAFDGTLIMWVSEQPRLLPLPKVIMLIRKIADMLQLLHNQQIAHLDINPSMILLRSDGQQSDQLEVRLADLGASTQAYSLFGKGLPANHLPLYMAPEQWQGQSGPATDQYALAMITYELLTGLAPFQGPPAQLMDAHMNVQPPAPSTFNQRVSPAIDAVILNALAKRPEDRFPSIIAFARALEQSVYHPDRLIVSVPRATVDGNLRATLQISRSEALTGTLRTITLPQGRRVTVTVPPRTSDGQIIRLESLGDSDGDGGSGAVILTIEVSPSETNALPIVLGQENRENQAVVAVAASPLITPIIHSGMGPAIRAVFPDTPSISSEKTVIKQPQWTPSSILLRARTLPAQTYRAFASLSPVRRGLFVVSIALIIVLIGISVFTLLQANSRVPVAYASNGGIPALTDTLRDNSEGYNWPESVSEDGSLCQFMQNAYHVSVAQTGSFHYCIAGGTNFGDFAYEVQMNIIKGDQGGLIFRADGANNKFYYFRVGRDGSYSLFLYSDRIGTHARVLARGVAAAVHTGLNISNILAVAAHAGIIDLYINHRHIASVANGDYRSGQIGLAAANETETTEVTFRNIKIWMV